MAAGAAFVEALHEALSRAGVLKAQCDYDDARGVMLINTGVGSEGATRMVPVAMLAAQHASCADDGQRSELLEAAAEAFGQGAADVPRTLEACGLRLLPQLWPASKIASVQLSLAEVGGLPHCGLCGEELASGQAGAAEELGVVLVCEYARPAAGPGRVALPVTETPVLAGDLVRWGVSFTEAMARAMENLRSRTKDGPPPEGRWEHHASGCGQSAWQDGFDAARCALLPALVARRKRPDGVPDAGGHVVAFAARSCVLATMSKNALGLCFLGDTLHTKIAADAGALSSHQFLSKTPYRLLKMRDGAPGASAEHPLNQKAGEGFVWRWAPYAPGGPPLRAAGEYSVPVDAGEVDAILAAAEAGRPVPVFSPGGAPAPPAGTFAARKDAANALFRAGEYVKAIAAYDAALAATPTPSGPEAAVAHANAAQAILRLAEADAERRMECAAEALRRAARAAELDPGYAKAHARCAAACDILGEAAAAADFRARAEALSAASAGCSSGAASSADGGKAASRQREAHAEIKA